MYFLYTFGIGSGDWAGTELPVFGYSYGKADHPFFFSLQFTVPGAIKKEWMIGFTLVIVYVSIC